MIASISSCGRFQFSVEKRIHRQIPDAALFTVLGNLPEHLGAGGHGLPCAGRPRFFAQRPVARP